MKPMSCATDLHDCDESASAVERTCQRFGRVGRDIAVLVWPEGTVTYSFVEWRIARDIFSLSDMR